MLFKPDHLNLRFQWQNFIYFSIINPARLFHRSSLAWNESRSNTGAGQHTHFSRNQAHHLAGALYHAISYFSSKIALRRIARVLPLSIQNHPSWISACLQLCEWNPFPTKSNNFFPFNAPSQTRYLSECMNAFPTRHPRQTPICFYNPSGS